MEGSESEAVFESLNLNPQLFINEVLNTMDDVVDDAFNFYHQQASTKINSDGTDRSEDLKKGVDQIRNVIQSVLDKQLAIWEKYCLYRCFAVPEGFSLPKSDESPEDNSMCENAICDPNLVAQLDTLREKLTVAGKESELLNRELKALERESTSSNLFTSSIKEALYSYEQKSLNDMFQEMVKKASELKGKMEKLKTNKIKETEHQKLKKICNAKENLSATCIKEGFSTVKLDDLKGFLADMKKL